MRLTENENVKIVFFFAHRPIFVKSGSIYTLRYDQNDQRPIVHISSNIFH